MALGYGGQIVTPSGGMPSVLPKKIWVLRAWGNTALTPHCAVSGYHGSSTRTELTAVIVALEAAKKLEEESGINAEVVDLRSIRPLDEETILKSVAKTNRVVLVDESKPFCGISSQIATMIQEKAFDDLDAPIKRVTSVDAPAIYSPPVEKEQIPNVSRIVDMVQSLG